MAENGGLATWLDGVTLEVEDVERSKEFSRRIPGVVLEIDRPGEFVLLKMGGTHIGLLRIGAPGLLWAGERGFHLEALTDDAELSKLHTRLGEVGIPPLGPVKERHWGERAFDIKDPDGNHIEFGGR